jgi:hypothetical protein
MWRGLLGRRVARYSILTPEAFTTAPQQGGAAARQERPQ